MAGVQTPIERVRLAVEQVPPGRVASYGDIGAIVGVGARQVGAIMRDHSDGVPWWRIVSHDGVLHPLAKALPHWEAEGIEVRPDRRGCRMRDYRADLIQLAVDYQVQLADQV